MLARELVQLAVLLAKHGPALVETAGEIEPRRLGEYWSTAKCRLDRWNRSLKLFKFVTAAQREQAPRGVSLPALLIEILTGEVLTRSWSAVLCAHDRRRGAREAEPIARSIYIGHLEARNRALHLLLDGTALTLQQTVTIDRLRRRAERWSDLLVARMVPWGESGEYAVDRRRALELAAQMRRADSEAIWSGVFASILAAIWEIPPHASPNADIQSDLASAILGCLPELLFDGVGLLPPFAWVRMSRVADDTQGLLAAMLANEELPAESSEDRAQGALARPRRSQRRF
ncbi:MAG: hypothetical protein K1X74_07755 [Pirellulales bacterium]|nr:hypothetical protein [Pirellulales bacterium]